VNTKPKIYIPRPNFPQVIERLQSHFEVIHNQADEVVLHEHYVAKAAQSDGMLTTGSDLINEALLKACSSLKICANMAVGFNNFDLEGMTRAGVLATNTPDVLTQTTADFGFALLMACARRMVESEHFLRDQQWKQWRFDLLAGQEVHGSTLGIIGMGRIGQAVAKRASKGFDMKVIYHNRTQLPVATESAFGATWVELADLLAQSDHVMLVLPYSAQSHHMIGARELAMMKPGAHLINIARGGLIDEDALVDALQSGHLGGFALDVFEGEPKINPRLLTLKRVVLTPHIASSTIQTRLKMSNLAADNLIEFFARRKAITPLNPQVLEP
jgi:glyoxylate/hydroxypyruvate/2-ketogluconate reductase